MPKGCVSRRAPGIARIARCRRGDCPSTPCSVRGNAEVTARRRKRDNAGSVTTRRKRYCGAPRVAEPCGAAGAGPPALGSQGDRARQATVMTSAGPGLTKRSGPSAVISRLTHGSAGSGSAPRWRKRARRPPSPRTSPRASPLAGPCAGRPGLGVGGSGRNYTSAIRCIRQVNSREPPDARIFDRNHPNGVGGGEESTQVFTEWSAGFTGDRNFSGNQKRNSPNVRVG